MAAYSVPGVYWDKPLSPRPVLALETGVPVFLGYAKPRRASGTSRHPWSLLTTWEEFGNAFTWEEADGYLAPAVAGFFQNGGDRCYVMPLLDGTSPQQALTDGLDQVSRLEGPDLVCAPDIMRDIGNGGQANASMIREMQDLVLTHCNRLADRFAILDSHPDVLKHEVVDARRGLVSENGALYYPWVRVERDAGAAEAGVPPCGHVAGVYARTDAGVGMFKAPANEALEGVVDLTVHLTDEEQGPLNELGVNCLRSFGARGIRVWGARTLSGLTAWRYVNVRRLFITVGRWIRRYQADICFESHTEELWARIERDVTVYLGELFRRGALKGEGPGQAFYVKCDAETNASLRREQGHLMAEIGLCARVPGEFIVVQLFQNPDGVQLVAIPEIDRT